MSLENVLKDAINKAKETEKESIKENKDLVRRLREMREGHKKEIDALMLRIDIAELKISDSEQFVLACDKELEEISLRKKV